MTCTAWYNGTNIQKMSLRWWNSQGRDQHKGGADMKMIPLTRGKFALVDDEDFDYLNQFKWYASYCKSVGSFYAQRTTGTKPHQKLVKMHRVIMDTPKGLDCDHINHDTLDNRKSNLRNITRAQNCLNRRTHRDSKSGEKNIYKHKYGYYVNITLKGVDVINKFCKTLEEARRIRDEALDKYHGEYAWKGR